jgi:hypothetical protein
MVAGKLVAGRPCARPQTRVPAASRPRGPFPMPADARPCRRPPPRALSRCPPTCVPTAARHRGLSRCPLPAPGALSRCPRIPAATRTPPPPAPGSFPLSLCPQTMCPCCHLPQGPFFRCLDSHPRRPPPGPFPDACGCPPPAPGALSQCRRTCIHTSARPRGPFPMPADLPRRRPPWGPFPMPADGCPRCCPPPGPFPDTAARPWPQGRIGKGPVVPPRRASAGIGKGLALGKGPGGRRRQGCASAGIGRAPDALGSASRTMGPFPNK